MKPPFLAWPGWPFLLSAANSGWFAVVYGGSDWVTAHRTLRVPIHQKELTSVPPLAAIWRAIVQ
jgi:hypothetical protein